MCCLRSLRSGMLPAPAAQRSSQSFVTLGTRVSGCSPPLAGHRVCRSPTVAEFRLCCGCGAPATEPLVFPRPARFRSRCRPLPVAKAARPVGLGRCWRAPPKPPPEQPRGRSPWSRAGPGQPPGLPLARFQAAAWGLGRPPRPGPSRGPQGRLRAVLGASLEGHPDRLPGAPPCAASVRQVRRILRRLSRQLAFFPRVL